MVRVRRHGRLSVVLGLATGLVLALAVPTASADSIQIQSYERADASEECTAQEGETPWQANWGSDSSWHPSWEQWANGGLGGPVCTRQIVWASSTPSSSNGAGGAGGGSASATCSSAADCEPGDIGPGGGLVFYKAGGVAYEMAPNTWGSAEGGIAWCNTTAALSGTQSVVGTGSANTVLMLAGCSSGAARAVQAYAGGGFSDWYLPSQYEYNAMCTYAATGAGAADPTATCSGPQTSAFAAGDYGFANYGYWTSTQSPDSGYDHMALFLRPTLSSPFWNRATKTDASLRVRPIRSF